MITDINQLDLSKRYSYADYLTWQFEEMVELIQGKVFRMSPTPGPLHQGISAELHYQIMSYLKGKKFQAYAAPFDVRLPLPPGKTNDTHIYAVVQPDISVICDLSKIDEKGCLGAPDWIIEILSKSTAPKDLNEKFDLYQHAGVKAYWIVHPSEETILVYLLNDEGTYVLMRQRPFTREESIPVSIFNDFEVNLNEIFH